MTLHTLITYSWDIIAFNYVAFSTGVDFPVVIIKWTPLHIYREFFFPPAQKGRKTEIVVSKEDRTEGEKGPKSRSRSAHIATCSKEQRC